jgi:hypothetical protein
MGLKPVWLKIDVPRVERRTCGAVRQVKLGFADPLEAITGHSKGMLWNCPGK